MKGGCKRLFGLPRASPWLPRGRKRCGGQRGGVNGRLLVCPSQALLLLIAACRGTGPSRARPRPRHPSCRPPRCRPSVKSGGDFDKQRQSPSAQMFMSNLQSRETVPSMQNRFDWH